MIQLDALVYDFARGLELADAKGPVSKKWQPGIGPHDERDVVRLVMKEIVGLKPNQYRPYALEQKYPESKNTCDLCFGEEWRFEWAIEVKALRMLGDRAVVPGRDDVSKILSPYSVQRSALTDCTKLVESDIALQMAILIYAYDFPDYPMMDIIEAFELLANRRVVMGPRHMAPFSELIHPVHKEGAVFAWAVLS